MSMKRKEGRWALVTGASSGIGKEFAFKLGSQGFNLVLIARRGDLLREVASKIESSFGVDVLIGAIDLSEGSFLKYIEKLCEGIEISFLVNNAGEGYLGTFVEQSFSKIESSININLRAHLLLTRLLLPDMIKRGNGSVIFVGSILGYSPTPYSALYSSLKSFYINFIFALEYELRGTGVEILLINPGATRSSFKGIEQNPNRKRSAEQVVETALGALAGKVSKIDGRKNQFLTILLRSLPKKISAAVKGKFIKKVLSQNRGLTI